VSETRRGAADHRPIGIYPMQIAWGGSKDSLRKALKRKGSKFGDLAAPYVVALNSLSWWGSDRIDQMEALFGSEQFLIGPRDVDAGDGKKARRLLVWPTGCSKHTR
jgi:hypothetical protein